MSVLKTDKLNVGYNKKVLIHDIDLCIEKGEILTLIGPNGAGKSTILKTIARQLDNLGGNVYVDEKDYSKIGGNEFAKKMAVMFTGKVKSEMLSCGDIVATGRYPYTGHFGLLSKEDKEEVAKAMELVNISDIKDNDFSKISDGQRQRVMLARAVCQDTDIIILDEPTSFLDIKYKLEFVSIIKKLTKEKNLTVIMSLHELEIAKKISDKIVCVKGDRIDKYGTPDEIFKDEYIRELYDIDDAKMSENIDILKI